MTTRDSAEDSRWARTKLKSIAVRGERLNGMIALSLNARRLCIISVVHDRTFLAP